MARQQAVKQSALVYIESTFASPSGRNIDTAGFDAATLSIPFIRYEGEFPDAEMIERNDMSSLRGALPPHVYGPTISGTKVARRSGEFTLSMDVEGFGALSGVITDPDDHPLVAILGAMLVDGGSPADPADYEDEVDDYHDPAPGAHPAGVNVLKPEAQAHYTEGSLFKIDIGDNAIFACITRVDAGNDVIVHTALPRQLVSGDVVRVCRNWRVGNAAEHSLGIQLDIGNGIRARYVGCVLKGITFELDAAANPTVRWDLTFQYAAAVFDHNNVSQTAQIYPDGDFVGLENGSVALSATVPAPNSGTAAPFKLALLTATTYVSKISLTIQATVEEYGGAVNVAGRTFEVVDAICSGDIVFSEEVAIDDDFANSTERELTISLGPTGNGEGFGLHMAAVHATAETARREIDGQRVMHRLSFRSGKDRGGYAGTNNSSFVIALPH